MKKILLIFLPLLFIDHQPIKAQIPDHSFIRPFPNSILAENMSKYEKFGEYEFTFNDESTNTKEKKKVKGKKWQLLYEVKTADGKRVKDISRVEFYENYKQAAEEQGGKKVYEDALYITLKIPREDGGMTWCKVQPVPNLGQIYLNIIDEEVFKKSLTFGPAEIKAALDKDGRIILYDILFDTDKADIKQSSDKQLQHVVTLLKNYPELNLEIQGHTDSKGSDDHNMKLSQQRAETVNKYLALFGIDSKRLKAKGYGETKPVASNDTEEGRAKNRRVELVKIK